jgi:type II secretory pathway component PulC
VGELYLPRRVEIRQGDILLALNYKNYAMNKGLSVKQLLQGMPSNPVRVP